MPSVCVVTGVHNGIKKTDLRREREIDPTRQPTPQPPAHMDMCSKPRPSMNSLLFLFGFHRAAPRK